MKRVNDVLTGRQKTVLVKAKRDRQLTGRPEGEGKRLNAHRWCTRHGRGIRFPKIMKSVSVAKIKKILDWPLVVVISLGRCQGWHRSWGRIFTAETRGREARGSQGGLTNMEWG